MSDKERFLARNIIIDGLPKNVTPQKRELFLKHLTNTFTKVFNHDRFNITFISDPETGLVSGAFLTCTTEADAETALAKLNMHPLTKSDILTTYRWSALKNAEEEIKEYQPPAVEETTSEEVDFTHTLAADPNAFPQYLIKGGQYLECSWLSYDWEKEKEIPCEIEKKENLRKWSELDRKKRALQPGLICSMLPVPRPLPTWSVYGHMLISETMNGLQVWGGREMNSLYTIPERVKAFMISPNEQYIVVQSEKDVTVMNLRTAKKIRTLGSLDLTADDLWPIVRFSADDSLAVVCKTEYRRGQDYTSAPNGKMSLYLSETMDLLQGSRDVPRSHTFEIPGLYKAEWNPTRGTQIAYVCALGKNLGWRLTISEMIVEDDNVVTEELQSSRMFVNAEGLEMLWHPAGTYLAVKVMTKKATEYALFHIGRDVAAFQMVVKPGYTAGRFAWQPGGDMFAILLNDDTGVQLGDKSLIQIHAIKDRKKMKLVAEYPTSTTRLFWSPKGRTLCLTNDEKSLLSFINVNEHDKAVERKMSCSMSDVQWDPTGRFFATWVSSVGGRSADCGYRIFSFNGDLCVEKKISHFSHFAWRPLPPSLLTEAETKKIRDPQNVKKLLDDYEHNLQVLEEERIAEEKRKVKNHEASYIKTMNGLAKKAKSLQLEEKRTKAEVDSRWSKYWTKRIAELPADERVVHLVNVEEREVYRRPVN